MNIMIKIFLALSIVTINLHASVLYVIDKRMYEDKKTGEQKKYPQGFFVGTEINNANIYIPVTPDGKKVILDAGVDSISFVRIYDPATKYFYQITLNQSGILLGGGMLEVTGFDGSYKYYLINNPSKIIQGKGSVIKTWQERK